MTTLNPFTIAQQQLDEAAQRLGLDAATHELLRWPMREYHFTLPVKMDNGDVRLFKGYRVQHNNLLGPFKGGMRFHPDVSLDDVKALAGTLPYALDAAEGGMVRLKVGNRRLTPVEVSAEILRAAKALAERRLDREVTQAVVTVPAYFDDAARLATKDAEIGRAHV